MQSGREEILEARCAIKFSVKLGKNAGTAYRQACMIQELLPLAQTL